VILSLLKNSSILLLEDRREEVAVKNGQKRAAVIGESEQAGDLECVQSTEI